MSKSYRPLFVRLYYNRRDHERILEVMDNLPKTGRGIDTGRFVVDALHYFIDAIETGQVNAWPVRAASNTNATRIGTKATVNGTIATKYATKATRPGTFKGNALSNGMDKQSLEIPQDKAVETTLVHQKTNTNTQETPLQDDTVNKDNDTSFDNVLAQLKSGFNHHT